LKTILSKQINSNILHKINVSDPIKQDSLHNSDR